MRLLSETKAARILTAETDKDEYKPGETVKVTFWLRPFREDLQKRTIDITLPKTLDEGTYSLMILDGGARETMELSRVPGKQTIHNFEQLVDTISRHYPQNNIYFAMQNPIPGITFEGEEMAVLPSSVRQAISGAAAPGFADDTMGTILTEKRISTDYNIRGKKVLGIKVSKYKNL